MPITLTPLGKGRQDYSQTVEKVYELVPIGSPSQKQSPLHWSSSYTIPASTAYTFDIYTVPSGKRLPVYYAAFSSVEDVLIYAGLKVNGYFFALRSGYGEVVIQLPNGFTINADQTLQAYIGNPNSDTSTKVYYYIQGIVEEVD